MDALATLNFVAMDTQPHLVARSFRIRRKSGVDGCTIWDLGKCGQPFSCRVKAYAASFADAQAIYRNTAALEDVSPIAVTFGGNVEPGVLYKVLRAVPIPGRLRRLIYARGPGGPYFASVELEVQLLPVTA
jgi:hypothetical protein